MTKTPQQIKNEVEKCPNCKKELEKFGYSFHAGERFYVCRNKKCLFWGIARYDEKAMEDEDD